MKYFKFFAVALFLIMAGCQEVPYEEPFPEMHEDELKCARIGKTITFLHFARLSSQSNFFIPPTPCLPEQAGVVLGGGGWIDGYANFLGKVNRDSCTFIRESCFLGPGATQLTTTLKGQMMGMRGDKYFIYVDYVADLSTMTFEGNVKIDGGTGIFKGATGNMKMTEGTFDMEGNGSWRGIGKITLVRRRFR